MKTTVTIDLKATINIDNHLRYQLKHVDRDKCNTIINMVIGDTTVKLNPETAYNQIFNAILNGAV
jgi:hypothetical protein